MQIGLQEFLSLLDTSGWIFTMAGGAVAWSSKNQSYIALSSMEFEYIAMSLAGW